VALENGSLSAPIQPNTDVANVDTTGNTVLEGIFEEEAKPKKIPFDMQERFRGYELNTTFDGYE